MQFDDSRVLHARAEPLDCGFYPLGERVDVAIEFRLPGRVQIPVVGQTVLRCDFIEYAERRSLDTIVLSRLQNFIYLFGNFRRRNCSNNSPGAVRPYHVTYRREGLSVSIGTCIGCGKSLHRFPVRWSLIWGRRRLRETRPSTRPEV